MPRQQETAKLATSPFSPSKQTPRNWLNFFFFKKREAAPNGGGRRRRRLRRCPPTPPPSSSPPPMPLTLRARASWSPQASVMPTWWKRSKSAFQRSSAVSSAPASPARASTSSCAAPGRRSAAGRCADDAGDLLLARRRQLTRQRKLRHVDDIGVGLESLGLVVANSSPPPRGRASTSAAVGHPVSIPIARSASSAEFRAVHQPPPRAATAASPVLLPLPLPSPKPVESDTSEPDVGGERATR